MSFYCYKLVSIFSMVVTTFGYIAAESKEKGAFTEMSIDMATSFVTPAIPALGGTKIDVRADTMKRNFFTSPVLLPVWEKYKTDLASLKVKETDKVLQIALTIRLWDEKFDKAILKSINKELAAIRENPAVSDKDRINMARGDVGTDKLHILPHQFYQIRADTGRGLEVVYPEPQRITESLSTNRTASLVLKTGEEIQVKLRGTYEELTRFYEERSMPDKLDGTLFSRGYGISPGAVLRVKASSILSHSATTKLIGDETFSSTVKVSGSAGGGGLSLNLGVAKFTGGAVLQGIERNVVNQRVVSRDFVNTYVRTMSTLVDIESSGAAADKQIDIITDYILSHCKDVRLDFIRTSDNQLKMGDKILGYVNLSSVQENELLKHTPSFDLNTEDDSSATIGAGDGADKPPVGGKENGGPGVTLQHKTKTDYKQQGGITWKREGTKYIPSHVDMHLLDANDLRSTFAVNWARNLTSKDSKSFTTRFLYPASYLGAEGFAWETMGAKIEKIEKKVDLANKRVWPPLPENIVQHQWELSTQNMPGPHHRLYRGFKSLTIPKGKTLIVTGVYIIGNPVHVKTFTPLGIYSYDLQDGLEPGNRWHVHGPRDHKDYITLYPNAVQGTVTEVPFPLLYTNPATMYTFNPGIKVKSAKGVKQAVELTSKVIYTNRQTSQIPSKDWNSRSCNVYLYGYTVDD